MTEEEKHVKDFDEAREEIKDIEQESEAKHVDDQKHTEKEEKAVEDLDKELDTTTKELEKVEGPKIRGAVETEKEEEVEEEETKEEEQKATDEIAQIETHIFALRTTANREDQVMDFLDSNVTKKKLAVFSVIRPHGMRGYIFLEAGSRIDAEQAAYNVPYARGILPNEVQYNEIENMLEQVKREINMKKNDIAEIISGPFKREQCKVTRIDAAKEEVVVELLESAVPIPITLKLDALKVIRREDDEDEE